MHIEHSEGKTIPASWAVPEATSEAHLSVSVGLGEHSFKSSPPATCRSSKFLGREVDVIVNLKA